MVGIYDDDVCSICLEDVQTIKILITTECSHVFCAPCSAQWFYKSNACPNCNHNNVNIYKLNQKNKIKKTINLKSYKSSSEYIFKKKIIREEGIFKYKNLYLNIICLYDFFTGPY